FQSPPDVLNNIIVHIYLNAKDKHSHTVATSPLIKGVFGIGTAHGGLGTHTDPIVITKDFDRDTLEFVEEDKAKDMIEEGPANIVEVKATVSSPDRKIENTVNKAVSTELERAIPAVINRLQGPMSTMDSELRKELEQALVEELAKNLGNTIDQMETKISDEDLGRLIEEGLTEIDKEFTTMASVQPSTIRRTAVSTTMTTTESTTHPKTTPPSTITRRTTMADVDEFLSESPFEKARNFFQTSPALPIKTTLTPKTSTLRTSQVVTSTRAITSTATTSARPRTRQWWETSTRPIAETTSTFASHSITTPTTTTTTPTRSHPIWTARRTTITRTEPTTTATQPTTRFSSETQAAGVSPNTTAWTTHRQTTSTTSTRISSATQLPHAAITDGAEFGFETENTLPSSMVTLIIITSTTGADTNLFSVNFKFVSLGQNRTTAAVSTTLSASYSSTEGASYTMPSSTIPTLSEVPEEKGEKEEDEEEEEEEKEGKKSTQVVTKIRPTNFGDENMIRARIEPEMLQQQITTLPEERDMNEVTSILPAITTATQATSIGPNIAISEVTSSTSLSTSESNLPPFEAIPGVFEEQRMTFAQEEFSTASEGQCPTPNDDSDRNRTDVLFLLDSSNSFNEHKFMHAIQLILDTVSHFGNIGPDGTQVSLVQYNSEPYLEFSLRKHNCKQSLIDDIADTDYMQGSGNMLGKAVEKVARFAFTKNRGDRPDAENVLVVLTNGQSEDRVQEPVEVAKKNNLTVLVIATLEANPSYLVELAGNMDNVFQLHTEPNKSLSRKLADRINSVAAAAYDGAFSSRLILSVKDLLNKRMLIRSTFIFSRKTSIALQVAQFTDVSNGTCAAQCLKIKINPPAGYEGVAVVKGQEDKEGCKKVTYYVQIFTKISTFHKSRDNTGHNYSLILHLKHHDSLRTSDDRAYLLQCFIGKQLDSSELTADLNIMKGELMIAETISLSSVPPTCAYSIRRDSPDGAIIHNAFVGQTVYHRWECDGGEEANKVYGIQIHNCHASDDVDEKFPIVDSKGCSTDLSLLSDPKYDDNRLAAYSESKAFAFEGADLLKFVCKLSLCTRDEDGCEGVTPPTCDDSNTSDLLVTRRFRHYSTAMEGALSSALSTKVGMAMNRPSTLQDRVHNLLSTKAASSVIAIVLLIAIIA
ncbi:hypothetical protein Angca_005642, partial [Angiostrongylus cantonensis]